MRVLRVLHHKYVGCAGGSAVGLLQLRGTVERIWFRYQVKKTGAYQRLPSSTLVILVLIGCLRCPVKARASRAGIVEDEIGQVKRAKLQPC